MNTIGTILRVTISSSIVIVAMAIVAIPEYRGDISPLIIIATLIAGFAIGSLLFESVLMYFRWRTIGVASDTPTSMRLRNTFFRAFFTGIVIMLIFTFSHYVHTDLNFFAYCAGVVVYALCYSIPSVIIDYIAMRLESHPPPEPPRINDTADGTTDDTTNDQPSTPV